MVSIYRLIKNDIVVYVGRSIHPFRRETEHKYSGKEFDYLEVIQWVSHEEAQEKETYWIDYYDLVNNGLNKYSAGSQITIEYSQKLSDSSARKNNPINPRNKAVEIYKNNRSYEFISISAAARYIGCHKSALSKVLNGKRNSVYGWKGEWV